MGLTAAAQAQTDASRAYSAELLSEAQSHTSTLAQPAASAVNVGGQIQFRYLLNFRDDAALVEDMTNGFQTRRTKIWVYGDVNEEFSYKVQGNFDRDGGSFELEDAYVDYKVNDQSSLRWGQFKLPFLREELVSSAKQLAAERSIMNEVFNQDRSQGLQWTYAGENFRVFAAFSDGLRTANTDFDSDSEADYAATARFEYMWSGDWKQFDDFTSWKGSPFAGMVGGAFTWQSGGNTHAAPNTTTPDVDLWGFTADVSLEGDSWNAYGAFVYVSSDPPTGSSQDDFGFVLQGGYAFTDNWEVFGRFDSIFPDDSAGAGTDEEFNTATVGVNYYVIPQSHAAKFTADVCYFLNNPTETAIAPTATGSALLPSSEDGQFALRLQFQLLF
jgi:hypothetical protein